MGSTGSTGSTVTADGAAASEAFKLEGGWLCLGFTNTVGWHAAEQYVERFTAYRDLVGWCLRRGVLGLGTAKGLLREARGRPAEAQATLERAIALREAIYRIFVAVAGGQRPAETDLQTLNEALRGARNHQRLACTDEGFVWEWEPAGEALDQMLWPIARSAAELLTSDKLPHVRRCANDPCGWLFVDLSRNHSRRWCAMSDCGNKVKARRHYRRHRGQPAAATDG
jgi:predicted RNA-binding Zn ribbon-like protein